MKLDTNKIYVDTGPGGMWLTDYTELWTAMFSALSHAIWMKAHGECMCGCVTWECNFCAHECTYYRVV